jgi:hypothetical protein
MHTYQFGLGRWSFLGRFVQQLKEHSRWYQRSHLYRPRLIGRKADLAKKGWNSRFGALAAHDASSPRQGIHPTGPGHYGVAERGIIALAKPDRLRRILSRILDENEFLSPYGIRALSRTMLSIPMSFAYMAKNSGWATCRRNHSAISELAQ